MFGLTNNFILLLPLLQLPMKDVLLDDERNKEGMTKKVVRRVMIGGGAKKEEADSSGLDSIKIKNCCRDQVGQTQQATWEESHQ